MLTKLLYKLAVGYYTYYVVGEAHSTVGTSFTSLTVYTTVGTSFTSFTVYTNTGYTGTY